ncbi:hypothetical protein HYPSUDRAFT_1078965 [Hypholoma sublateritium FD-334 SS-4]|uniref:Uncharacterized protein n=1 Tax=Hypholoma sublateritium (strain FD-334 SS-4) TaxID=945553 RepID=A0A0D2KG03_HYPSF|nr:hypothetical protein HYPSUDRAFT_1078965 [Hypholoma sublateritium FD-334 SS-4]
MLSVTDTKDEAVYPLTLYDNLSAGVVLTLGWLVEGSVDIAQLEMALDNAITKWTLLNGRIERIDETYQVKVQLHGCPPNYRRFALSSKTSTEPLSNFVTLPLGLQHNSLPSTIFRHAQAPRSIDEWINNSSTPLTHWHVTHFPGDQPYSCIGLTFPHVAFDGLGIAAVIHAVEAELLGQEWRVPTPLHPGNNENLILASIKQASLDHPDVGRQKEYISTGLVGIWWILSFLLWSHWQIFWKNSKCRMLIIPPTALQNLIDDTRQNLVETTNLDSSIHLSKGDIITAFLFKTIFSDENLNPNATLHLGNLASLRRFFNGSLAEYPHNCVMPLPYRPYTAHELRHISISDLAYHFYQARQSFTEEQALQCYNLMLEGAKTRRFTMFFNPSVNESAVMSNMIIANIANVNWTGTGAGRTLCSHKITVLRSPLAKLVNVITILGYLDDGSLVLELNFGQKRFERLAMEVQCLIDRSQE